MQLIQPAALASVPYGVVLVRVRVPGNQTRLARKNREEGSLSFLFFFLLVLLLAVIFRFSFVFPVGGHLKLISNNQQSAAKQERLLRTSP